MSSRPSRVFAAAVLPLRAVEPLFWFGVLLLTALFLGSGAWIPAAAIVGLLAAFCVVLIDLRLILVLLLIGSPTIFVFANNFLDAIPFVTVERGMLFGLTLLLVLGLAFRLRRPQHLDRVEALFLLFLLVAALSMVKRLLLIPQPPKDVISDLAFYAQGYLMPFLAYWCARRLEWRRMWVDFMLYAFVAMSVWMAATAAAQTYLGIGFFMPTWIEVINEGRATGSFSNATEFGAVCALSALAGLVLLRDQRDGALYVTILACVGAALVALFLCKTRAPWLGALLAFGVMFLYEPRLRPLITVGAVMAFIGGVAALPFIIQSDLFQNRVLEIEPIFNRLTLLITGGSILIDNIFLGLGFSKNAFASAKGDYLASFGSVSWIYADNVGPPHNEWLHIFTLTGLAGGLLYLATLLTVAQRLRRLAGSQTLFEPRRAIARLAFAAVVVHLTISVFVDLGFFIFWPIAVFAIAGVAARPWAEEVDVGASPGETAR